MNKTTRSLSSLRQNSQSKVPLKTVRNDANTFIPSIVINDVLTIRVSELITFHLYLAKYCYLIAVYIIALTAVMTSELKVLFFVFVLLSFISDFHCQNQEISEAVKNIFLTKPYNSTDTEWILKLARKSYSLLKETDKKIEADEKLNFAKKYANFLLKLFNELQAEDINIYKLFSKQNSFLKDYNAIQISGSVNVTELKLKMEDLQFAAERLLIAHHNSSDECFEVSEILALNETSFDVFLKEKLRTDYSEIGYFFLEVFATLIGLSWGIISTVIYYTESATENVSRASLF